MHRHQNFRHRPAANLAANCLGHKLRVWGLYQQNLLWHPNTFRNLQRPQMNWARSKVHPRPKAKRCTGRVQRCGAIGAGDAMGRLYISGERRFKLSNLRPLS